MNVYDFDETIFVPDSSVCFVRFCMRHYPRAVFRVLPGTLWQFILYLREGRKDAGKLKESMFSFLNRVDNVDRIVEEFWEENFARIEPWYLQRKRGDDLIISASPEFLIAVPAERLGVRLLASRVDKLTGKTEGENCWGAEKVRRLHEAYPDVEIAAFYSDSRSDSPLAELADVAYLVKGEKLLPW